MRQLFADENFPLPVVLELRRLGHHVVTIQETGKGGQALPDEDLLMMASEKDLAVLTLNRKYFIALHRLKKEEHRGIIVCTFDPDFTGQADRINKAITSHKQLAGQLIRVNRTALSVEKGASA